MEEDILELIAQNNSEMQELYLSEEFEELLEICNKSTSDVALLYKALALFEICNFQAGHKQDHRLPPHEGSGLKYISRYQRYQLCESPSHGVN